MSRRKQQNPRHLETCQELAVSLQNGIASGSDSEEDEHVCGRCRAEFPTLSDFIKHKTSCTSKRPVLVFPEGSKNDDPDASMSNEDEEDVPRTTFEHDKKFLASLSDLPQLVRQLSDTNVTLEHLRNTTVAVAQHGRSLPESQLAALLSNIHLQQVAQLHVIQELQAQILGVPASPKSIPLVGTAALTPPQSGSESAMGIPAPNGTQPSAPTPARTTALLGNVLPEEGYEPNTLELLQRHTEQALQNTMAGGSFLLSNTGDFTGMKRSKDGKVDDVGSKHACRFCGKVFGSDSGLQIHLRSHTGERPFKCSVCGSCFSTKGNLKVHFQRHKERMEVPGDFQNGNALNGDPIVTESNKCGEKATDFSSDKNSPCLPGHSNGQSGSDTPNDVSALSDDSDDGSENCENELTINEQQFDDDDDDHDSDASGMNDHTPEGDSDNLIAMQHMAFSTPNFTPFFRPTSFSGTLSDNPLCLPHPTSSGGGSENGVYHRDPTLYQELLPRVGSNDSSWESLMEVTETSETSKLQKLVDNIEVADPNQCIICHRVLSCRSALQMHYRTHTGERPFRCKICGRAFTTKGNLKTHMSVHRHKPPSRMLHQCPVCHKQFANSVILQQHIRMHTAVRGVVLPDAAMYFPENKSSTLLPPSYPRPMLMPPSEPLALTNSGMREKQESPESVIKTTNNESQRSAVSSPVASTSGSASPVEHADDAIATDDIKPMCMDLAVKTSQAMEHRPSISECSPAVNLTMPARSTPVNGEKENRSVYDQLPSPIPKTETKFSLGSENVRSMLSSPLSNNSPDNNRVRDKVGNNLLPLMLHLPNDKPLPMTLPSDCPIPLTLQSERQILSMSIPSTTSELTASLTALENHVKAINSSTTNPLPFPPPLGLGFVPNYFRQDFGIHYHSKEKIRTHSPSNSKNSSDVSADESSTSGRLKSESPKSRSESGALDLTPRGNSFSTNRHVTDLKALTPLAGLPFPPPHTRPGTTCQLCFKTFACQSALEIHYRSHTKERPFKCDVCDRGFSTKGNMKQHMLTHKIRDLPPQLFTSSPQLTTSSTTMITSPIVSQNCDFVKKLDDVAKRPLVDGNPSPKRSSGIPKHVCEVCHKPFSSGSALQIHMRTHTGVKPFQCNICSRAFTTKGNLKVHMGTHLSNNGTSRRGRRMSLDIAPLGLPLGKPGEYPPRHDMFFPYLPPFLNGLTQTQAKMNEISVIQSAGSRDDVMAAVSMTMSAPSFVSSARPLALVTSPSDKQEVKRPDDEARILAGDQCSPGRSMLPSEIPPVSGASWPWKIACIRCNKICSSSTELEIHVSKEHSKIEHQPLIVDKSKEAVCVESKT